MTDPLTGLTPAGRANPRYKRPRRRHRLAHLAGAISLVCRQSGQRMLRRLLGAAPADTHMPHVIIRWHSSRMS